MTDAGLHPWRSSAAITLAALAVFGAYRLLPRGGRLTHMDFLADDATVLELCNPLNPAPVPVSTGSLPVTISFSPSVSVVAGSPAMVAFDLTTVSGRPVAAQDLEDVGGRRIELKVRDGRGQVVPCTLGSTAGYKVQPDPFHPGRWGFSFMPTGPGPFAITAEFTPVSTGKPLSTSANLYFTGYHPGE